MTPLAETLADRLASILAADDGSIDSSEDAIIKDVVRLIDDHDAAAAALAIGPIPADAEAGFVIEGAIRRALREMRHDTACYGDIVANWPDEKIDRMAAGLCIRLGREWFGVC